jgi:hypothetical protein
VASIAQIEKHLELVNLEKNIMGRAGLHWNCEVCGRQHREAFFSGYMKRAEFFCHLRNYSVSRMTVSVSHLFIKIVVS